MPNYKFRVITEESAGKLGKYPADVALEDVFGNTIYSFTVSRDTPLRELVYYLNTGLSLVPVTQALGNSLVK